MERIGLVVNPKARRARRRSARAARLAHAVGAAGGEVAVCDDLDALARAATHFRDSGVTVVAVGGGDGTACRILTAMRDAYGEDALPAVALLRGGTMNTVANGLGVRMGRPEALLSRTLKAARHGRLQTLEVGTLDIGGRLGFLGGVGVVHGFLAEYYDAGKGDPTPWTAVTTLARGAASTIRRGPMIRRMARRVRADVTVDGVRWPHMDWFTVAAGTAPQIGLGFKPFFRSTEDLTRIHVLGVHGTAPQFLAGLPAIWLGRSLPRAIAEDALASEVRITVDAPDRPIAYMVDGDLDEARGELVLRAGPPVSVVMP